MVRDHRCADRGPYPGQLTPKQPAAINDALAVTQGVANFKPVNVTAPVVNAAISGKYKPAAGGTINRSAIQNLSAPSGLGALDAYMNPYVSKVVDTSLNDLDRARLLALNQGDANMTVGAGADSAFGTRGEVERAETNRGFADAAARTLADLYSGGFNTATGLLMSDRDRALQTALANQGADLSVAGQNAQLAQQLGIFNAGNTLQNQQFNAGLSQQTSLANAASNLQAALANQTGAQNAAGLNLQAGQQLAGIGGQQYGMAQDALLAAYNEFLRQQNYPYQQQQALNSALGLFGSAGGTQQYMMPNYTAVSDSYRNFGEGTNQFAQAGQYKTVICSALARRMLLSREMWTRADMFGSRHPTVVVGYRLWANAIARRIDENADFAVFMERIARPFIQKLADGGPDFTPMGILLGAGVAICWCLGLLYRRDPIAPLATIRTPVLRFGDSNARHKTSATSKSE